MITTFSFPQLHPIEGVADSLASVAASVRGTVYGLQCTQNAPLDRMEALARFYLQHVRATQPQPPYTLLGYSFGASLAVEMALQLESQGCSVRLILVEGSPVYVAAHISRNRTKGRRSISTDEADALSYFTQTMKHFEAVKTVLQRKWPSSELERLEDWDARVARVTGLIMDSGLRVEKEVLKLAAYALYRRLVLGDTYKPVGKLAAPVMLFRARDNYVPLNDDYGLREMCAGELISHELAGTHQTILEGESGSIIAEHVCNK